MSVILEELNTASDRFESSKRAHDETLASLRDTEQNLANRRLECERKEEAIVAREVSVRRRETQVSAAERLVQDGLSSVDREKLALAGKQQELDQRIHDHATREATFNRVQSEFKALVSRLAGERSAAPAGPQITPRVP
jgi:hypothetical protein